MMAVRSFFFLLCFAVTATTLHAQTLRGTVVQAETGEPLYAATLKNSRNGAVAFSDFQGAFSIAAIPGDAIAVSSVGYQTRIVYAQDASITVRLSRNAYSLDEFVVRPGLSPYQHDSARRKADYARVLEYTPSGSVMNPVSLLAEAFSKKKKMRLRFQKDFYRMEQERFVDSRYTPDLVAQQTGLSGDTAALFMNQYPMPFDYARAASDLELKMWIRTNFREWEHAGRPLPAVDSAVLR